MRVAVYGLGYVGSVTAACLAGAGHAVTGVDVHPGKVASILGGESPIVEQGLGELVRDAVASGALRATTQCADAADCDVAVLCVGTPSLPSGAQDLSALERVVRDAGRAFAHTHEYPVVIVRSTVLPGVLRAKLLPALEGVTHRRVGASVGLCVVPEFLREGSGVADFRAPPMTVVGALDERAATVAEALFAVDGSPRRRVDPDAAVMVKYASNAFHALKVAFANEVDALCDQHGVDGRTVMDLFCLDDTLNLSARYLRPGFAFGGSCLPKDLRALVHAARHADVAVPVIESVMPSNALRIQRAVDLVAAHGARAVALVGLSFKPGTDDLRESPLVTLAETLLGKGVSVRIHDPSLTFERVTGANRAFIERAIPHLERLLAPTLDAATEGADLVLLGHADASLRARLRLRPGQSLVDLTRMPDP